VDSRFVSKVICIVSFRKVLLPVLMEWGRCTPAVCLLRKHALCCYALYAMLLRTACCYALFSTLSAAMLSACSVLFRSQHTLCMLQVMHDVCTLRVLRMLYLRQVQCALSAPEFVGEGFKHTFIHIHRNARSDGLVCAAAILHVEVSNRYSGLFLATSGSSLRLNAQCATGRCCLSLVSDEWRRLLMKAPALAAGARSDLRDTHFSIQK
jgi:hypothetical protein